MVRKVITPDEFKMALILLEQKRINTRIMERRIHKAFQNISDEESALVRDAEHSGFGNKVPDLRGDVSYTLRRMRIDNHVPYAHDYGAL